MQLQVAGWTYPRHTYREGNALKMEVARVSCRHCPTCSRRVEMVGKRMQGTSAEWHWETAQGGLYLAIKLPEMEVEVDRYLGSLLGLRISQY